MRRQCLWAEAGFFICAYAAYWFFNHKGKVFGDDQDGFITIPIIDENEVRDGKSERIKVYNKLIRDKILTLTPVIDAFFRTEGVYN
ncbi:hypothetical protein [Desulfosporosinus lacus]|uniref:hypothetical protein n=1 Tax=Desulfosporosinus lacus TaxID=329936 RepID=UPI0009343D9C|nr:hypothetical protein [Desulfosporosinus lacus]